MNRRSYCRRLYLTTPNGYKGANMYDPVVESLRHYMREQDIFELLDIECERAEKALWELSANDIADVLFRNGLDPSMCTNARKALEIALRLAAVAITKGEKNDV